MDDIGPIRVFLEVAAQNSFAGAARSLGMTPAKVTRSVGKLEEALGQQVLVRTTRRVALTRAGAVVAARYAPLLKALDQAHQEITDDRRPDRGHLSINAPVSFGVRVMPRLLAQFRAAYPKIEIDLKMTDTLVDIMEESCDLAIRISDPPTDKSTIWRKICQVPRYAVVAPHLLTSAPTAPEDLPQALCLSYASGPGPETWRFRKGAQHREVQAGTGVVSNNGDFLFELAAAGGGIAVLPEFILADGLAKATVQKVLPDWTVSPLWLTLYYPPYDVLPPLVATFTAFFEDYIRGAAGLDMTSVP